MRGCALVLLVVAAVWYLPSEDPATAERDRQRRGAAATDHERQFRELDVVARRGTGLLSDFFAALSPNDQRFSHVGLLLRVDGEWMVLHAETSNGSDMDGVKLTHWRQFASASTDWALFRLTQPLNDRAANLKTAALALVGTPFDSDFDLATRDRLYCTELLARIFEDGAQLVMVPRRIGPDGRLALTVEDAFRVPWLDEVSAAGPTRHTSAATPL